MSPVEMAIRVDASKHGLPGIEAVELTFMVGDGDTRVSKVLLVAEEGSELTSTLVRSVPMERLAREAMSDVRRTGELPVPESPPCQTAGRVAAFRKQYRMSQHDLARAMRESGFSHWRQTTVSRTEKDQRPLRVDEWGMLRSVLPGL